MAYIQKRKGKRGTTYRVLVRLKGFPTKSASFDRQSEAAQWGEVVEHALLNGLPLPGEEIAQDDKYISEAVDDYLLLMRADTKRSDNTKKTDEDTGKRVRQAFGEKSLRTLTREDIEEHRDDRLKLVGPATVRQDMSMLSRIYDIARIKWRFKDLPYPGKDIPLPSPPPNRKKVVGDSYFNDLFEACKKSKNKTLYPLVRLMLNTGMRPSEACLLRWHQIDFQEGVADLTKTKTDPRLVPLSEEALEMLETMKPEPEKPNDLLFMTEEAAAKDKPPRFFRRSFEQACIRAKVNTPKKRDLTEKQREGLVEDDAPRVTLYTLRHSAATYLLESGVDIRMVAAILGHSNITQTMRYTHPGQKALKAAVNNPGLPWKGK